MKCLIIIVLLLQGVFCSRGRIEISLMNSNDNKVIFDIPKRYYKSNIDTQGHGIMMSYDLVGSETHIIYSSASNTEIDIDNWTANQDITTGPKRIRKGIRNGIFWRSDSYFTNNGGRSFIIYGYGQDSLEITRILDSVQIK